MLIVLTYNVQCINLQHHCVLEDLGLCVLQGVVGAFVFNVITAIVSGKF